MKYVKESLNEFKDEKFFATLNEEDEHISPADRKKLKLELEKQGMQVVKKCINNFSNFKKNAGDIWQEYRDFWSSQKEADESVQQEGMFYNLWESDYIVGVVKEPNGTAKLKVFNTSAKEDEYIAFETKNPTVIKEFTNFVKGELETTMKNIIQSQKDSMKAKKDGDAKREKEESASKKKEQLSAFLSESRSNESDKLSLAINDIITYHTLPPQIDYTLPFKMKADRANEYIETLPDSEEILADIDAKIDEYLNSDAPEMNAMF